MQQMAPSVLLLLVVAAAPAAAQSLIYAGLTTAVDAGERGNIPDGTVTSIGALFGLRVSESWGVELELERAFRTTARPAG